MSSNIWTRVTEFFKKKWGARTKTILASKLRQAKTASEIRDSLRMQAKSADFPIKQVPALLVQLRESGWSPIEIEKVRAYSDFFSGASQVGYRRVLEHDLAKNDYVMFMTACTFCYLSDRFAEAAVLLDSFEPDTDPTTDWREYLPFAGFVNSVAGRDINITLAYFDRALKGGLFSPALACNAHPIYFEVGDFEKCRLIRELVQKECPSDPEAIYALACADLARNYYPEGFRLMESRYRIPALERTLKISLLKKERWEGQDLVGKRLLVHGEQGLGDMVMMSRYLPFLRNFGAELLMDGRAEAASLIEHNFPYCKYLPGDVQAQVQEPFDMWVGSMSLPHYLNTTAFNVPYSEGYLTVPPEHQEYWHARIEKYLKIGRLKVGIAWSGNPGHRADRRRSIPFELVQPLISRNNEVLFFSLQTKIPNGQPSNLIEIADELLTMADTAAVINEMDLIVSVDTSAIHLAGALGRHAWLLLPYRYEWRWGLYGDTNPWYECVRVWRQPKMGAWDELLEQVSQALSELNLKVGV